MNVIDLLQREQEKPEVPVLRSGDTVRVHVKVVEGTASASRCSRAWSSRSTGPGTAHQLHRPSRRHGVGVERTFLVHSPRIDRIEVLRHGDVRRAKLYYLRDKVGKRARIRERREPIGGSSMVSRREAEDEPDNGTTSTTSSTRSLSMTASTRPRTAPRTRHGRAHRTGSGVNAGGTTRRPTTVDPNRRAPEALPPTRPLRERVGHAGENAALHHLKEHGFRILARDWRSRIGQIDIVAEDGETLVIVEVKARRGVGFGLPEEAVDARKRQKLRMLMETYRSATKRQKQPCRIDVLGLLLDDHLAVTRCEHIRDAVSDG